MTVRCLWLVLIPLLLLCSCAQNSSSMSAGNDNLGLEQTEAPPSSSSEEQAVTEGPLLTEEQAPQISQMDKEQVSKTYTYLKEEFSDGVYYLNFVKETPEGPSLGKREYVLASDGKKLYIRDFTMGYSYLVENGFITAMNDKNKTAERYELMAGSEFSYSNYADWFVWSDYEKVEFTAESAGTKSRPKLTETFTVGGRTIRFYYYRNTLSSVSATEADGSRWLCTVKGIHGEPKASLFSTPANYKDKK